MKDISDLKERGKYTLENFKALMDELQVQVALGKKEAKDIYDKERKILADFIRKERALLRKTAEQSLKHEQDLMDKFAELEKELDQKVPTTKTKFDAYKKLLLKKIYQLEFAIKTESYDVRKSLQKKLDLFKTKLDGYRLQVAMSNYEHRENLQNRKIALVNQINDIRSMVKDRQAEDRKWENFSEEISTAYKHLNRAFSDLLA